MMLLEALQALGIVILMVIGILCAVAFTALLTAVIAACFNELRSRWRKEKR